MEEVIFEWPNRSTIEPLLEYVLERVHSQEEYDHFVEFWKKHVMNEYKNFVKWVNEIGIHLEKNVDKVGIASPESIYRFRRLKEMCNQYGGSNI